ncbi:hypothetical protein [Tumebacillus permanentifrigoris]|uniref:Uncharacterized protein n=1 Tax=Tumebacillus permanentifrigoris TaxID=378543 RepID=A0A316D2N4_9BACL|nr:hypothetical protein [Tumebacillus permanentifrigoris]PWK05020.1 hypothetical protein C7459_12918 [Tumebacillus permanentifrigoris]
MLRITNVLLVLVAIGLCALYNVQIDSTHSLWTDSEGQLVRMDLGFFSATLSSAAKSTTYYNYGAYPLILLAASSLLLLVKKK